MATSAAIKSRTSTAAKRRAENRYYDDHIKEALTGAIDVIEVDSSHNDDKPVVDADDVQLDLSALKNTDPIDDSTDEEDPMTSYSRPVSRSELDFAHQVRSPRR